VCLLERGETKPFAAVLGRLSGCIFSARANFSAANALDPHPEWRLNRNILSVLNKYSNSLDISPRVVSLKGAAA
jgi:hypothetical protein